MKGARCGDQDAAGREEPHGPPVDLVVAAERAARRRSRDLAKAGGSTTTVSNRSRARSSVAQHLEGIALLPADVGQPVERRVGLPLAASASSLMSRASTAAGPAGQVEREGAVVGEAVQRPAARRASSAGAGAGWAADRGRRRSSGRSRARPGTAPPPSRTSTVSGTAPQGEHDFLGQPS